MIKWLKKLLGKGPPEQPTSASVYIWGVVDGPYLRDDFPEEELRNNGIPEEAEAMLVCKIEEDGEVSLVNYWYGSMDEAYEVKKYFDVNMEPLEIRYE
jgi:hypothetical protein